MERDYLGAEVITYRSAHLVGLSAQRERSWRNQ